MADWLSLAATLSGIREQQTLTDTFVDALKSNLQISNVWVMLPCQQGRKLCAKEGGQYFDWEVDDFSHPFAHVFQSSSSMLLDPNKLNYWQENAVFVDLMNHRQRGESVLVMPLPPGARRTKAILTLTGSSYQLSSLLSDPHWASICEVFINQSQIIQDLGEEHRHISALSSSIKRIRSDEQKREQVYELKNVLIGESQLMQEMREKVVTAAQSSLNVMVCGDTGTGKELVARAVHELSDRKGQPFIAINCAAIPENLLESELFGHVKGAFSGADSDKQGLIADAQGGTLFLDEIGDMPLALQAKLLRVLETRTYRSVGGANEVSADFRLVSATHVKMEQKVEEGSFRRDLYYRLNQFPVLMPALNSRKEDIPALCKHFVTEYNKRAGVDIAGVRYAALDLLNRHSFPGNVRELRNLVEYACALTSNGDEITPTTFSERLLQQRSMTVANSDDVNAASYVGMDINTINNLKEAVQQFEISVIRYRLSSYGGDRSRAAESLGLPKRTLAHKCLKMEID